MHLVDHVGAGQSEAVEQVLEPAPGRLEAVLLAGEDEAVQLLGRGGRGGLVD